MLIRDFTCGACGETFGTNFTEDEITCANCEARRCPHCLIWFGSEEGHESGWPTGILTARHPDAHCLATPPEGQGHEGEVQAYVRLCPEGHLRAGYACGACAGSGAILCHDCSGKGPAILIPAQVFAALPFGAVDEQLRQITEMTDG